MASRYGVDPRSIYDYAGFNRIRDNPAIDVVYIVLPNGFHAEFTVRAFQAGKHVFCGKPMANTVAECEAMICVGQESGRKLMIAYRAHFEPQNVEAIRRARSGETGVIRLVTSDQGRLLDPLDPADQWRMVRSQSGGG